MPFLEQIERKQKRMMEEREQNQNSPKTAMVPASEIDPKKGLAASSYVPGVPDRRPAKTLALKPEAEVHDKLKALGEKMGIRSKKEVARRAMLLGIAQLEELHP